jgi:hypothetical protein
MDEMNVFEQQVARDALRDAGPSRPVDAAAVFARAAPATQSPKWRFQAVFSATKFVVAGAIVALFGGFLLAGIATGPGEQQLPAAGASASQAAEAESIMGATIEPVPSPVSEASPAASAEPLTAQTLVVASDGNGEFSIIKEAVDAAADGDTILVRPGTYLERVLVDKDIVVRGDGDRSSIVIAASATTEPCPGRGGPFQCALWLRDADATVAHLTVHGPVSAHGGSATLEDLVVDGHIEGGGGVIRGNSVSGGITAGGDEAVVEDNDAQMISVSRGEVAVRRNRAGYLSLRDVGGVAEQNEIVALADPVARYGVQIELGRPGLVFRDNLVRGHDRGIYVNQDAATRVVRNRIEGSDEGILIDVLGDTVIRNNAFCDNETNVKVKRGPDPKTTDSCIEAALDDEGEAAEGPDEASAVEQAGPDAGTTIDADLLPGVDLVTAEVEPGVYRVLSDGVRDLSREADDGDAWLGGVLDGGIVAGLDGSVWWLGPEGFLRLGDQTTHTWPVDGQAIGWLASNDFAVALDGTL